MSESPQQETHKQEKWKGRDSSTQSMQERRSGTSSSAHSSWYQYQHGGLCRVTALHEASAVGDEAVVEELLKAGANVNARSCDGVTPLHDAVSSGHYQVVALLLQYGSNASDRTVGGLSALDMAEEVNIKELLLTFQASSVVHEQLCEAPTQYTQQAESFRGHNNDFGEGAEETNGYINLVSGRSGGYRSVSDFLQQRVLKSHLVCIALHQRNLVEILQNQMHLVEVYVTMKAILSTEPHTVVRQQPDHFSTPASTQTSSKARAIHNCNQDSLTKESHRPVTQASLLRSALPNNAKCLAVPRHPAAVIAKKKAPTHTDVLNEKASTYQRSAPQPGNTLQHINFKMKGINALIEATAADNSRHLSKLIQRGIMPSGSALQLLLKGHWHLAHVLSDGSIKDSKGKFHLAPEDWLESVLGNNIPVSSEYAWDKVRYRDKPLSNYILDMEAEENTPQTHPENDIQHCRPVSSQEALITEADSLNCLMKIKMIHLLDDEEFLPNALVDCYWEKLLKKDYSESEDWEL
ncbi:ankyrin repeat domain-containing protein 31-like isoform X3 [Micropterus salmoides]|uniref:ankyrin repeat domain-containing protein 31-like isoform X3 n=1 Tax=Micropterus salmoides TaxID=27706 RepID=UPI0018EC1301|nr:ankyrin repeat domain-containing protein 31-like isoform X3 [Micropterus salmoides]